MHLITIWSTRVLLYFTLFIWQHRMQVAVSAIAIRYVNRPSCHARRTWLIYRKTTSVAGRNVMATLLSGFRVCFLTRRRKCISKDKSSTNMPLSSTYGPLYRCSTCASFLPAGGYNSLTPKIDKAKDRPLNLKTGKATDRSFNPKTG